MSTIHLVGGEKGGVGKSMVARVLAQYLIDGQVPFAGIDADRSNPTLSRYYEAYVRPVALGSSESADQIMDRALGAERRVLVDLPAQSIAQLTAWMAEGEVLSFAEETGVNLRLWHVTDGGYDSVQLLGKLLDTLGERVPIAVVKNEGRSDNFGQFEDSPVRHRLAELGGHVIEFPRLDTKTLYAIDSSGQSFWSAINNTTSTGLSPMDRQRTRIWLKRCYQAFEEVDGWI